LSLVPNREDFLMDDTSNTKAEITGKFEFLREKTENTLRNERDFNHMLVQASPAFFVAINADGRTMMMSNSMLRALEYGEAEVVGKDYLTTFVPKKDHKKLSPIFDTLITSHEPTVSENIVVAKDGRELLVEWHGRPIFREDGTFDFFIGVGVDVTERNRVRKELQIEKAHLEQLFESSPEAVALVDNDSRIIRVNEEFTRLFGYTKSEAVGLVLDELLVPKALYEEAVSFTKAVSKGSKIVQETVRQRKDGTAIPTSVLAAPITIEGGQIAAVYAIYRDITERKEAEDALRESEEKYRTILDAIEDGYYEVDLKGNFTFFNRALIEILGYTEKELMGMNYRQYTRKEDVETVFRVYNAVYQSGLPAGQLNWELIRKDEKKLHIGASVSLIRDYEDRPIGFRGILRDVTERKEAEELYETLATTSRAGVYIVQDGKFCFINYHAARYAGYREDELIGMDSPDIVHPEDRDRAIANAIKMVRGETSRPYEFRIVTKDGNVRWIMETLTSVEYQGKRAILGNSMDVTELREARKRLEESEKRLSQIVEGSSVSTFVINSNHRVTHWNKACEGLTGIPARNVIATGKQWSAFYFSERPTMSDLIVDQMQDEDMARYYGNKYKKSDVVQGAYEVEDFFPDLGIGGKWLFITAAPLKNIENTIIGAIETIQDVTERKEAEKLIRESEQRYQELSITDNLTNLFNRRHFYNQLGKEIERTLRYDRPLSILLLDVDNFKHYNDTYGHLAGDEVLVRLADVILRNIRRCDSAYRYGGEEFLVVLPETGGEQCTKVAERVRDKVKRESFSPVEGDTVHVTVSIGVSQFIPGEKMTKLIKRADERMYLAKERGRDQVISPE